MVRVSVSIPRTVIAYPENVFVRDDVWVEAATFRSYRAISAERAATYYTPSPSLEWLASLGETVAEADISALTSHEVAHASLWSIGPHYLFDALEITAAASLKRKSDRVQLATNMLLDALLAKARVRSTNNIPSQIPTIETPRQPNAPCSSVAA